ncbi:MAG: D-aminoacyl-tRNA deacylase [Tissierellia bacterium]|nr:D-aminoacyl-tRNA deacylase [Tissierellia bacterium]
MRAVVQRVSSARVRVGEEVCGEISKGFLVLLGVSAEDTRQDLDYIVRKILNLRVFDDEKGIMNRSIQDIQGDILLVSQFTLYGDARKGNRPSYIQAAKGPVSEPAYLDCIQELKKSGLKVESGRFGADMEVELSNHGPVTILLDSERNF